ncbi:MAG TPA: prolyl oligopeptidase family serine peptidase, partial [Promineifilum sp.]|nr:prolyl oligopeptidase family serine peptidase [Promineifilum sp.]
MTARIESLLSARLFQVPQIVGDRIFFVSNLSGRLSLYVMDAGGSVPEPLLPPDVALQNPHHVMRLFQVYPDLGKILIMLDHDGDENYQPMWIPIDGGYPEAIFGEALAGYRCHLSHHDEEANVAYFYGESRQEPVNVSFRANLATGELTELYRSMYGGAALASDSVNQRVVLNEGYTVGDNVLLLWEEGQDEPRVLYGQSLTARAPGEDVPLTSFGATEFTPSGDGLLLTTGLFEDTYGLATIRPDAPHEIARVEVRGAVHSGAGEMENLVHLRGDRYAVQYNIDGCTWLYEGQFDEARLTMQLGAVICGQGELAGGVMDGFNYDRQGDCFVLSFSTATSPTQIYTVGGPQRDQVRRHTRERVLGLPAEYLSPGEDASFVSHDGLRVSARLYLPPPALGYEGPRPVVYYVHGGPQGQERPDFAWFSMPLIQFLALNGFAVFVPNVRGSTGYGLSYTKHIDRDWGGQDRLDHVHAMKLLADDARVDASRAAVIGRSYGGYMTLTLAARHPELWSAAVDMFGPYDLLTFIDRLPETWKPYFAIACGDPVEDRDFLIERSPRSYITDIQCPLLVIQGRNDPRVIERESRDVVEQLRALGKEVEYLMFADEGHDVLKYENRVTCYN